MYIYISIYIYIHIHIHIYEGGGASSPSRPPSCRALRCAQFCGRVARLATRQGLLDVPAQILAWDFRSRSLKPSNKFPLRSKATNDP